MLVAQRRSHHLINLTTRWTPTVPSGRSHAAGTTVDSPGQDNGSSISTAPLLASLRTDAGRRNHEPAVVFGGMVHLGRPSIALHADVRHSPRGEFRAGLGPVHQG